MAPYGQAAHSETGQKNKKSFFRGLLTTKGM